MYRILYRVCKKGDINSGTSYPIMDFVEHFSKESFEELGVEVNENFYFKPTKVFPAVLLKVYTDHMYKRLNKSNVGVTMATDIANRNSHIYTAPEWTIIGLMSVNIVRLRHLAFRKDRNELEVYLHLSDKTPKGMDVFFS